MDVAVIGAGWAGLAAAVAARSQGYDVTVFEATRTVGGRARTLLEPQVLLDGTSAILDNGQHILSGAYTATLQLLDTVGVDAAHTLLPQGLDLRYPDGTGLRFPDWHPTLDLLWASLRARGWHLRDALALLRNAAAWQSAGFSCNPAITVAELCAHLPQRVRSGLIDPLCVSALNTPAHLASAHMFLRVLHDGVVGCPRGARLLLPTVDLGRLFPQAALAWLREQGVACHLGERVESLVHHGRGWRVGDEEFSAVLLATDAAQSARILHASLNSTPAIMAQRLLSWAAMAQELRTTAIATVYAWGAGLRLPRPMCHLPSDDEHPAQFVFDRGQLGGPAGLLAFVVSDSNATREHTEEAVLHQAREQLGWTLTPVQTVVEKRATFCCEPRIARPPHRIAPGLLACADFVANPYPATLEGAVRNALDAVRALPVATPLG
ncbi:hydroxysqualene dehydroxylase [Candidatus Symbiobacter mobilis]|uniref:NAD/FAD-binding-like protein n=1 Tax=Candidatus Symbiobacter mobilis CR TaxID=946483 RepID=U5N853_9BURK|nr:FAD-dependent oxidoreductase [Candidatus Symbiobacter mobilis]AGX87490.1 NAD/FAD-binding-like protein [Candidatus Symbiobacter mobilis CR]